MKAINMQAEIKVIDALAQAQKACKARMLSLDDLKAVIYAAEEKLHNIGVAKKNWVGCVVDVHPGGVPNSYAWRAEGTYARIERKKSGWFVTSIWRGAVHPSSYGKAKDGMLTLSDLAKNSIPTQYNL